jgi:predicted MPP superfamily phosphohydrolase
MFSIVLMVICASQLYWFWRAAARIRKAFRKTSAGLAVCGAALAVYLLMLAFNVGWLNGRTTPTHLTPGEALLGAPFTLWLAGSLVASLLLAVFWIAVSIVRAPFWAARKLARRTPAPEIQSPQRRAFLNKTANVVAAAPFVAGAYGFFKGRLDLEVTRQPIHLARLPAAFQGFRIAQLSDIHIGPFMTQDQIRKYAEMANALKPDLTVLTGDFVTWDGATQYAVVQALSGLTAPFGVFGCLGNHDAYARVQDSIAQLFLQAGIRILRRQSVPLATRGESLNLMGIDYAGKFVMGSKTEGVSDHELDRVQPLIDPDRVNILLSHNPNTFDRAAELGIDLSLAGHTHGGQAALEFISPDLAPSRLVTPYVAGLFARPGGQLYVNRGIGTIGVPVRLGAPPEITLFELTRG